MVEITDQPTTLHPSPSSPFIPISPFLTPFLVSIFWLRLGRAVQSLLTKPESLERALRREGEAPAEPGFARDLSGSAGASPSRLGIS
jgi:hypothetical protein